MRKRSSATRARSEQQPTPNLMRRLSTARSLQDASDDDRARPSGARTRLPRRAQPVAAVAAAARQEDANDDEEYSQTDERRLERIEVERAKPDCTVEYDDAEDAAGKSAQMPPARIDVTIRG